VPGTNGTVITGTTIHPVWSVDRQHEKEQENKDMHCVLDAEELQALRR
jgi:hypothetical protein